MHAPPRAARLGPRDPRGAAIEASAVTKAPPAVYERHVGRYASELAAGMVGVARLDRGKSALDVGCGPGGLAEMLAALLGAEHVAAVDPSEAFAETCRSRVPGVRVLVGKAEALPFADREFDGALAQLVVDGMEDAEQGVAEMRRVTRPGGVVAACIWDYRGGMPLLDTMWAAALELDADRARSFGAGTTRPFSRAAELEELWLRTGLEDVSLGRLVAGAWYDGMDDLWVPFEAGVGNLGKLIGSLDDAARARMKAEVARRLAAPDGRFRLVARAVYVRGVAP